MSDIDPVQFEQLQRTATPMHVGAAVTSRLPPEDQFKPYRHTRHMNKVVVEAVTDQANQRFVNMMVSVRSGKSDMVSTYLPIWFLGMYPDRQVILISANLDKASDWSAKCRNLLKEWGPTLFGITVEPGSASKEKWTIKGHRGGLRAVGAGGMIQGLGGDLVILDDPVSSRADVDSDATRTKMLQWYLSDVRPRLMPGGTLILAMARWRFDDLSGSLIDQANKAASEGVKHDPWEVVFLPMRAVRPEDADEDWRDEIGRADGELLWPEVWSEDIIAPIEASDPVTWASLYQQDPSPPSGGMFDPHDWRFRDAPPEGLRLVRSWDLASSEGRGDYTVGALVGMDGAMTTYILDIRRFRKRPSGVEENIKACARADGTSVPIRIEQERAGAGSTVVDNYKRMLVGWDVQGIRPEGSKESRAQPLSGQQGIGNVVICGRPDEMWVRELIEEFRRFPRSSHDDQIDGVAAAFNYLAGAGATSIGQTELSDVPLSRVLVEREPQRGPWASIW